VDRSLSEVVEGSDDEVNAPSVVGPAFDEETTQNQGNAASESKSRTGDEPKILQLLRGDVYPPSNGGEVRIWNTSKKFADLGTVWVACPADEGDEYEHGSVVDTDNPFLNYKTSCIYAWNALFGLSANNSLDRLQSWKTVRELSNLDAEFDIVCCEAPQMLSAGRRLAEHYDAKLLINKHNAMFDLLDQQIQLRAVPDFLRRRAVENLRQFEQAGIDAADAVVFQSENDVEQFTWPEDTVVSVIPNGTDFAAIDAGGNPEQVREQLGVGESQPICVFVGAFDYDPNEVAAEVIAEELAPALPDVEFLLVGRDPPNVSRENVHTPGFVEDLPGVLSLADVAVCPLTLGSGTKLKMLDYLAAGLPIVTTGVGTQGLPLEDGKTALVRNSWDEFASAIETLVESESARSSLAANAKELGEQYAWKSLMEGYEPIIAELLS
jgi:glycosyltransferase involved in cell wall biosynthesis